MSFGSCRSGIVSFVIFKYMINEMIKFFVKATKIKKKIWF